MEQIKAGATVVFVVSFGADGYASLLTRGSKVGHVVAQAWPLRIQSCVQNLYKARQEAPMLGGKAPIMSYSAMPV